MGRRFEHSASTFPAWAQHLRVRADGSSQTRIALFDTDRFGELHDWNAVKLLTVLVDRLLQWHRPGLILIGDAAHAMSPIGRVGINHAIQDAVAVANILADPLRTGRLTAGHLSLVQQRREWPTHATQRIQLLIQNRDSKRIPGRADVLRPPALSQAHCPFPVSEPGAGQVDRDGVPA